MSTSAYTLYSQGGLQGITSSHRYNDGSGTEVTTSTIAIGLPIYDYGTSGANLPASPAIGDIALVEDSALISGDYALIFRKNAAWGVMVDDFVNIGTGAEVFKGYAGLGQQAQFRKIRAGSNVTVTQNTNDITIASTGGGTSYWQTSGTGIRPTVSGYEILPNGTADIGASGTRWNKIWAASMDLSGDIDCDDIDCDDIWMDDVHVGGDLQGPGTSGDIDYDCQEIVFTVVSSNNVLDLFNDDYRIKLDADHNIYVLPSNNSYTKDWNPNSDCTYDLGSSGDRWRRLYYESAYQDSCDVAELQWVEDDYVAGTVVEMTAPSVEQLEYIAEEDAREADMILHRPSTVAPRDGNGDVIYDTKNSQGNNRHFTQTKKPGITSSWTLATPNSTKKPSIVSAIPGLKMGSSPTRDAQFRLGKMKYIGLVGSVPNVFIVGAYNYGDILVSAGSGNAMVDNDAPFSQIIGHSKGTGSDSKTEVWIQ